MNGMDAIRNAGRLAADYRATIVGSTLPLYGVEELVRNLHYQDPALIALNSETIITFGVTTFMIYRHERANR